MRTTKALLQFPCCSVSLLASEVSTLGGIQAFMFRLIDVLAHMSANQKISGYCYSLNDKTNDLRLDTRMPRGLYCWGAHRSKLILAVKTLTIPRRQDLMLVGHIGLSPLALILKKLRRVKDYVVILHGIEAWQPLNPLKRKALEGAKCIIATTRFTANQCAQTNKIHPDHFRVIPLCADRLDVEPSQTFRLHGDFKVLSVGRQVASERYKGFDELLQAVSALKDKIPNIHMNFVGAGDDQDRLRRRSAALNVADLVTFWNLLTPEDLAAAYQDCDVFAMPSKSEGFGIVFLEAMRYGKPCIGGDHGGTPEVIDHGNTGYLVQYGDIDSLVTCLFALANNSELRRTIGLNAKQVVRHQFNPDKFIRSYQLLIEEILSFVLEASTAL